MKKFLGTIILFILFYNCSQAQQFRNYSHFIKNPYLYNPAFAGYDKKPVIIATHRQQWMGIEGAPVTSNLSFHTPLGDESPVSLGTNVYNDRQGIFSNWGAKFTFAYALPLAVEIDHYIKFGLSGGISMNEIDLGGEDISGDNVLENLNTSTFAVDGRFGVHYRFKNLSLGFTIPQLFEPSQMANKNFNEPEIERLERMIFSGNYSFDLTSSGNIAFQLVGLYHMSQSFGDQWEAAGLINLFKTLWVGGGFNPQSGPTAMAGVNAGENLSIGYAFGTGGNFVSGYGNGTHEIQLKLGFGKKRETVKRSPRLKLYGQDEVRGSDTVAVAERENSEIEDGVEQRSVQKVEEDEEQSTDSTNQNPNDQQARTGGEYNEIVNQQDQSARQENESSRPSNNQTQSDPQQETPFASGEDVPVMDEGYNELGGAGENQPSNQLGGNRQPSEEIGREQSNERPPRPDNQSDANNRNQQDPLSDVPPRFRMEEAYYVIAGTFSSQENAENFSDQLFDEGFFPEVGYHEQKEFYYVYLFKSNNQSKAREERNRLRQYDRFKNAWLLHKN